MNPFLVVLLTTVAIFSDPFTPAAPPPQTTFSQSVQLHPGWNLVSWNIVPMTQPIFFGQILDPNDPNNDWFFDNAGRLYQWNHSEYDYYYGPGGMLPSNTPWILDYAYYFYLRTSHSWGFDNKPLMTLGEVSNIQPSTAWNHDQNVGSPYASYWFFLGYAAPEYCKLASIPNVPFPDNGDPANFDFEGPFHYLIWHDESQGYGVYDLKIVKTDDGRVYIPHADEEVRYVDYIGALEPGRGYFLGFTHSGSYTFEGWQDWSQWRNDNYTPPSDKEAQPSTYTANHFQFHPYTHWSYPVEIDTVDLTQVPLSVGDEIGAFDGDRCVGAATFEGEFPLIITSWEDDIATPDELDGYIFSNPMTFKWYDASTNTEAEFEVPPITQAADDPISPDHSGFGQGLYGQRSFMEGIINQLQLPTQYKLGQNYPNPFNSATVIPLELPQRSKVKIEVFNLKGQRVGNLYESVENAGYPKIYYDASRLASGVYFCRVTAEGLEREGKFCGVSKLVLLK